MTPSPIITHLEWGSIQADGLARARDLKLWPGGGRAWDWRETGTRHAPGIQIADVEELLANGAGVVVLSRGMDLVLQVMPETIEFLRVSGIQCRIEETNEAANLYNELVGRGLAVGGLFHSTC